MGQQKNKTGETIMQITLKNYTKDGIKLIADAVKVSSSVFNDMEDDEIAKMMVMHDYGSVLEHVSFTFELKDISIALSRELLEHRITSSSHTAKSTRYISDETFNYYVPPKIMNSEDLQTINLFRGCMDMIRKYYILLEDKVDIESARYVLPMATMCTYIWTINVRSLINFLRLRLCKNASPEIQELASNIHRIVSEIYPVIFEEIGCRGSFLGVCPESNGRSCHKYSTKKDLKGLTTK